MPRTTRHGKPKTVSLRFSSKRRGTIRKLQRLILRPNNKSSWQLPQLLLQCNSRKWHTRLLQLLRGRSSHLNLLGLNNHHRSGLKVRQNHTHQIEKTMQREAGIKSSSPPLSKPHLPQNFEVQPFPLPVLPRPDIPVGGRLAHFVEQWEELTNNKWVLSIVRNRFKIPFKSVPPLSVVLINLSQSSSLLLQEEIVELLRKRAVERVQNPGTPSFYSQLFLVPKTNGRLHPVIDLSLLNHYIHKQHFKMETVKSVRQSIMYNDWAVSIDLKDAYLHVPIHPISRKYLRFVYDHQAFQFTVLPFRMSLSLWVFTKLMNVIATHLRPCTISLFPYPDEWLIRDLMRNQHRSHQIYSSNGSESRLHSKSKEVKFDSNTTIHIYRYGISNSAKNRVPADRVKALILTIKTILSQTQVSARTFLSLLGKLSAASDLILLGRLHLRPLQMCLLSVWKPHILPLDHQVPITRMIKFHLKWWINNRFVQGMPIHPPDPEIYTDASHFGWGAHLEPMSLSFHGRWSEDQSWLYINMLEIMAIRFTLIKASKYIRHSCVKISTDNTTVVSYINKQGGMHSPDLCVQVWKIPLWCLKHQIVVRIWHIPGKFNVLADRLSRTDKVVKTEWALDQSIANSIFQMFSYPNLDLFVTRFNHKLPLYVSLVLDNQAFAIDAFSMSWNYLHAYAFPPTILIPSVLNKICQSQCRIVLIAPLWPQQAWFSEVLQLLVSAPVRLPLVPNLLSQGKLQHQNLPALNLHAWELSNNQLEIQNLRKTLRILSPDQDQHQLREYMTQNGPFIPVGVIDGRLIRSRPLLLW